METFKTLGKPMEITSVMIGVYLYDKEIVAALPWAAAMTCAQLSSEAQATPSTSMFTVKSALDKVGAAYKVCCTLFPQKTPEHLLM